MRKITACISAAVLCIFAAQIVQAEDLLLAKVYRDYPGYVNPAVCENPNAGKSDPGKTAVQQPVQPVVAPKETPPPAPQPAVTAPAPVQAPPSAAQPAVIAPVPAKVPEAPVTITPAPVQAAPASVKAPEPPATVKPAPVPVASPKPVSTPTPASTSQPVVTAPAVAAPAPVLAPPPAPVVAPVPRQDTCGSNHEYLSLSQDALVGPYATIWGGIVVSRDIEISHSVDMSTDNGYGVGIAVGYDFGRVRFEIEGSHRENNGDKLKTDSGDVNARDDLKVDTILAVGYADFATGGAVTPYLGVGAGYARAEVDDLEDEMGVAQLAAGVLFAVSPRVAFDLGYKYLLPVSHSDFDLQQHAVTLGLQVHF